MFASDHDKDKDDERSGLRETIHLPYCIREGSNENTANMTTNQHPITTPSSYQSNEDEEMPPHRLRTPPVCMARQSASIREAAKFLSRFRLRWREGEREEDKWPQHYLLVHKMAEEKEWLMDLWPLLRWIIQEAPTGKLHSTTSHSLNDSTFNIMTPIVHIHESLHSLLPQDLAIERQICFWTEETLNRNVIDLVISVGGDGTVLQAAWLFQQVVPPIVPFHFGTVGFLNVSPINSLIPTLSHLLHYGCRVNIRMRLHCQLRRNKKKNCDGKVEEWEQETYEIMNEMVVDRGSASTMILMDLFIDDTDNDTTSSKKPFYITTVQADGLIVATPTGSTAYSLSAGGPIAHPEIPTMLITPICPHTLSLRPLILPDSLALKVSLHEATRSSAWIAFDGRRRVEFEIGDELIVTCSNYPVPTVCHEDQTRDWFGGLAQCLHWNDRPGPRLHYTH